MQPKKASLSVLELAGTAKEVAFQVGQKRAKHIEQRIEYWNQSLSKDFAHRRKELRALEQAFLKTTFKATPQYVEEIRAMAQGAGVSFKDLFRLNLTELKPFLEKCTTLVIPVKTPKGRAIFMGHNEDWDAGRNDVFVLKAHLPGVSYVALTYDGYLPGLSCGFNSHGLYHAVNYLCPNDFRVGLPRIFITHYLLTAPSIHDCITWIQKQKRAFGQSIHLAQKDRYLGLELTAKKMVLRRPTLPMAHANHYLSHALLSRIPSAGDSSKARQKRADFLIRDKKQKHGKKIYTVEEARAFAKLLLGDEKTHPYAIWRVPNAKDSGATLATVFLQTGYNSVLVYRENPRNRHFKS